MPYIKTVLADWGLGMIKNGGRLIYGSGQAVVGVVTENDELVESGIKNAGKGVKGLGIAALNKFVRKKLGGEDSGTETETEDID